MQKRYQILQIGFLFFSFVLLGKLAYEQLYHSALITNTLSPDSPWLLWLKQLFAQLPF